RHRGASGGGLCGPVAPHAGLRRGGGVPALAGAVARGPVPAGGAGGGGGAGGCGGRARPGGGRREGGRPRRVPPGGGGGVRGERPPEARAGVRGSRNLTGWWADRMMPSVMACARGVRGDAERRLIIRSARGGARRMSDLTQEIAAAAEDAVAAGEYVSGERLDYSEASLAAVQKT